MRIWLRRLILLLMAGIVVTLLWDQRHRITLLSNNNIMIQGDWFRVEGDFKGAERYRFSEGIITLDNDEWGSYELRKNTEIEVMVRRQLNTYHLEFPDEDNMVWSVRSKGELVPRVRWRR